MKKTPNKVMRLQQFKKEDQVLISNAYWTLRG